MKPKRLFDIFLSYLGLAASFPLWLIFGLAIFLEDGNRIFYLQERVGKDGRIFKGFKFRSMIYNAEEKTGPIQASENDPRMTKVGRFLRKSAMDELPQLLNILKGDMSFVGPRALRAFEIEVHKDNDTTQDLLKGRLFIERSKIIPGLTGVAQIFAPRDIPRIEKFKYDVWYINNRNLYLDLKLLILSFMTSFLGKWEVQEEKLSFLTLSKLKNKINGDLRK